MYILDILGTQTLGTKVIVEPLYGWCFQVNERNVSQTWLDVVTTYAFIRFHCSAFYIDKKVLNPLIQPFRDS